MPEIIRLDPHYRRGNRNPERLSRWTQSHWANEEPSPQGLVLTVMSLDNAQLIPEMLKRCGFRDKKKKLAVRFCLVLLEGYQSLEIWPGLDCRVDTAFAPQLGSTPAHRHGCSGTSTPPPAGDAPAPQRQDACPHPSAPDAMHSPASLGFLWSQILSLARDADKYLSTDQIDWKSYEF